MSLFVETLKLGGEGCLKISDLYSSERNYLHPIEFYLRKYGTSAFQALILVLKQPNDRGRVVAVLILPQRNLRPRRSK